MYCILLWLPWKVIYTIKKISICWHWCTTSPIHQSYIAGYGDCSPDTVACTMDSLILRCNIIRCRNHLEHRAVVTTCSHIFCTVCAEGHGLLPGISTNASLHRASSSHTHFNQRVCPACRTGLVAPDDAVLTTLNPSEDYKTSLLSGLNPGLIMEIAGRGLAFWNYQATQEVYVFR